MKTQITVGTKLTTGFAVLLTLLVVLSVVSIRSAGQTEDLVVKLVDNSARKVDLASNFDVQMVEMLVAQRGVYLGAFVKDPSKVEAAKLKFDQKAQEAAKTLDAVVPLLASEQARKMVADLRSKYSTIVSDFPKVYQLSRSDKPEEAYTYAAQIMLPVYDAASTGAKELTSLLHQEMAEAKKGALADATFDRVAAGSLAFLGLGVGLVVLWIVRQISRTLRQVAGELGEGADQVASAASQVSSSSQSLAQGSSEQAASLEETSASSEEISCMAAKNTENSRSAADLVTQSQQKFVLTNQSLEQTVVAMGEINAQSGKISKIIKVIDEIAFQTNILALNAAVEAARAGEAGMGFAVVADEVRNLAQRCAQAAKDTADLIEESIAKSNDGKTKVDQVAAAIRAITQENAQVKTLVDEVNMGSQEQATGIQQIGKAIAQMEQVTQKTAADAEESASAAEELNAQSDALRDVVEKLTAMVGGGEASRGNQRRGSRASGPRRQIESAKGLTALGKAVSHPGKSGRTERALVGRTASKDSFPMEEQFTDF